MKSLGIVGYTFRGERDIIEKVKEYYFKLKEERAVERLKETPQ